MTSAQVAVGAACGYFFFFGAAFLLRPQLAGRLGLAPLGQAGRTEIRCYYGGLSWALSAYFSYLLAEGHPVAALTGVFFLAAAVLATRIVGTTVDGGWRDPYTRTALPTEAAFVIVLGVIRLLS